MNNFSQSIVSRVTRVTRVTKVPGVLEVRKQITLGTPNFWHFRHFFFANLIRKSFDN
jgi:hypothetical protein